MEKAKTKANAKVNVKKSRSLLHCDLLTLHYIDARVQPVHVRSTKVASYSHTRKVVNVNRFVSISNCLNAAQLASTDVLSDNLAVIARRQLNIATSCIETALGLIHLNELSLSVVNCQDAIIANTQHVFPATLSSS